MARPRGGAGSLEQIGEGENLRWRGRWRSYHRSANGRDVVRMKRKNLGLVAEMTEEEARERLALLVQDDIKKADFFSTIKLLKLANKAQREKSGVNESPIKGMVAELTACIDLAKRGYEVFKAVNPIGSCDLMVWKGGDSMRVEVKHGIIASNGRPICNVTRNAGKYDLLALVTSEGSVCYFDTNNNPKVMGKSENGCVSFVVGTASDESLRTS